MLDVPSPSVIQEEAVIAGMIFKPEFLKAMVASKLITELEVPFARVLAFWCAEYWVKYSTNPGSSVREIYATKKGTIDEDTYDLIGTFLARLIAKKDIAFDLDIAKRYVRGRTIQNRLDLVQQYLSRNDIEEAEKILKQYEPADITDTDIESAVIDSREFTKETLGLLKMFIHPWLTKETLAMIFADKGIGKSWLCLILATALTRRRYSDVKLAGGWHVKNPAGVLYIDGEMSEQTLQDRIKLLELNFGASRRQHPLLLLSRARMYRKGLGDLNIAKEEWRNILQTVLAGRKEIEIVFLDNISSLAPGIREDKKEDWDDINQWLIKLRFMGKSVVIVHHATKQTKTQRGTSGREDALNCSIYLRRPEDWNPNDGAKFVVSFDKPPRQSPPNAKLSPFVTGILWTGDIVKEQYSERN